MLGLENSNPGRKFQLLHLQFFSFEKGFGSNAPSSPPRIAVFVEDLQCQTALSGSHAPTLKSQNMRLIQNLYIIMLKNIVKVFGVVLRHLPVSKEYPGFLSCVTWLKLPKIDSN